MKSMRAGYDTRSYTLSAGVQQSLPSAREFLIISASVDITAIGFNLGDNNGDFEVWPYGFAIGVTEGSVKARIQSSVTQTVVVAMIDGIATVKDNRFAPGAGTLPVTMADGASVALGARADAAATTDGGTFSLIALTKRLLSKTGLFDLSTLKTVTIADAGLAGLLAVGGNTARGVAPTGNPVRIGGRVDQNLSTPTLSDLQMSDVRLSRHGSIVTQPYADSNFAVNQAAPLAGLVNTTVRQTLRSATAGQTERCTGLQISVEDLNVATELTLTNVAASQTFWRIKLPAFTSQTIVVNFDTPLASNSGFQWGTLTASGAGAVYLNYQGFIEVT